MLHHPGGHARLGRDVAQAHVLEAALRGDPHQGVGQQGAARVVVHLLRHRKSFSRCSCIATRDLDTLQSQRVERGRHARAPAVPAGPDHSPTRSRRAAAHVAGGAGRDDVRAGVVGDLRRSGGRGPHRRAPRPHPTRDGGGRAGLAVPGRPRPRAPAPPGRGRVPARADRGDGTSSRGARGGVRGAGGRGGPAGRPGRDAGGAAAGRGDRGDGRDRVGSARAVPGAGRGGGGGRPDDGRPRGRREGLERAQRVRRRAGGG